jgi:hypothetical protein
MPVKKITFVIMSGIIIFATAMYSYEYYKTQTHLEQFGKSKFKIGTAGDFSTTRIHGKASGVFQVDSEVREQSGSQRLIFSVLAKQDVSFARLQWHLPEAVRLLNGPLTLALSDIKGGELRKFEIEVSSLNRAPAFAEIFTMVDGIKMGATAPFADRKFKSRIQFGENGIKTFSAGETPRLIQ